MCASSPGKSCKLAEMGGGVSKPRPMNDICIMRYHMYTLTTSLYFTLSWLSQLPEQKAMPSFATPMQETLLSWPERVPTCSPFRLSKTRHAWSSYPANNNLPEIEKSIEVTVCKRSSCAKQLSSLSARKSKRRQLASSEAEPNASPSGKNLYHHRH